MSTAIEPLPEIAFYYPGHIWRSPEWIKTLLLFFDGIGLLVPEYKTADPELVDPVLAGPLRDQGLLHYLVADKVVGKEATGRLTSALDSAISAGVFDTLAQEGTAFHEISMSRMGYYGDPELAEKLYKALKARGLAKESKDGVSIPLHPLIRNLILVMLAQILRGKGATLGFDLSPATDRFLLVRALTEFLDVPIAPSAGHVVSFDLQTVSVDLGPIPLDEVLSFRAEHYGMHREYIRSIRQFAREVSLMPAGEQDAAFKDRQAQLDDLANSLKRKTRSAWRRPASFSLGLAGAFWTYHTGDPVSALLGAGAMLVGGLDLPSNEAGAFSYLFAAHDRYA